MGNAKMFAEHSCYFAELCSEKVRYDGLLLHIKSSPGGGAADGD
jgi:hypothetical protein